MTKTSPRVSVGMPVYNGERFLRESIESILTQTFEDFELIISDNASTDRTEEICREYLARDKRIRYFRNESNIGLYKNCNRVFQLSSCEYFKFAASDDVCHPDLVARCLQVLDNIPDAVLAYPKAKFIDAKGSDLPWSDPGWDLRSDSPATRMRYVILSGHWVNVFFGLMRARELANTRLFPTYNSGDFRLIGELSLMGKFIEVPEQLFYRRIHHETSSQDTSTKERAIYFKGTPGPSLLPFWRLCFDHALTIFRSSLNRKDKLMLYSSVINRMYSAKRELFKEIGIAMRLYSARPARSS